MNAEQIGARPAGAFGGRDGLLWPSALFVIVAYSAVVAIPGPFTWPARIATAVPALALIGLAVRRGWLRRHLPTRATGRAGRTGAPGAVSQAQAYAGGGATVWVLLLGAAIAVQLFSYVGEPRETYPTLSSILEEVLAIYPVRALLIGLWIWVGWHLFVRTTS